MVRSNFEQSIRLSIHVLAFARIPTRVYREVDVNSVPSRIILTQHDLFDVCRRPKGVRRHEILG